MEKIKRKGNPEKANRRFALVLVGFIAFSMWISISVVLDHPSLRLPFITLQYPFINLTPIFYLFISLAWIPFAIKHRRIYGFSKLHWTLLSVCLLSVALMTCFQYYLLDFLDFGYVGGCFPEFEPIPYTPFATYEGWYCILSAF